jgi:phosphoglycerate dehydrogenase-like enzyme
VQRILFHFDPTPAVRAWLAANAGTGREILYCPETDDARFDALVPDVDVIWHVLKPLGADAIARATRLKLVQKIGVGVNTIALEAARERGIAVCNMPGMNARAVAEMTLLLMLATLRRLPLVQARLARGEWAVPAELQDSLGELGGRTVGLVGTGNVPKLLAPWLVAMGARVLWTNRSMQSDLPGEARSLDALLAESDVVSLHAPTTPETRGLIDAQRLARMKSTAILVNTARGELVDEPALVHALRHRRLAAAGLDVFASEPVGPDHPLLALDNVVAAPHVAWLTPEMFARSLTFALDNCARLAEGRALASRVA